MPLSLLRGFFVPFESDAAQMFAKSHHDRNVVQPMCLYIVNCVQRSIRPTALERLAKGRPATLGSVVVVFGCGGPGPGRLVNATAVPH
jgi:hypothetical protein